MTDPRHIIDAAIASGHLIIVSAPPADRPGGDAKPSPAPCVSCGHDTAYGSGRFVNRIPADGGYICEECAEEIAYRTPAGHVCRECGDTDGREWGPDMVPVFTDEAREDGARIVCAECGNLAWDPAWEVTD